MSKLICRFYAHNVITGWVQSIYVHTKCPIQVQKICTTIHSGEASLEPGNLTYVIIIVCNITLMQMDE